MNKNIGSNKKLGRGNSKVNRNRRLNQYIKDMKEERRLFNRVKRLLKNPEKNKEKIEELDKKRIKLSNKNFKYQVAHGMYRHSDDEPF